MLEELEDVRIFLDCPAFGIRFLGGSGGRDWDRRRRRRRRSRGSLGGDGKRRSVLTRARIVTILLALGANHVWMFCWEWGEWGGSILGAKQPAQRAGHPN